MSLQKYRHHAASLMLIACLAGCGGGSGNSTATSTMSLTGSAAKGFLIGADVTLYTVTDGKLGEAIARTMTDENGDYRFDDIKAFSGPALIEVKTRANSMMLDELKGSISAPEGMVLRAAVPDITVANEVHLTPFSEMAVSAAAAAGPLSAAAITAANAAVEQQYLGNMPVLETRPLKPEEFSSSDSESRRTLTKALTALVAATEKGDATDENRGKCNDADYATNIKCAVRGLSKGLTLNADGSVASAGADQVDVIAKGLAYLNQDAVSTPSVKGEIPAARMAIATAQLGFEARFTEPSGTRTTPALSTPEAIAAARTLFADMMKMDAATNPETGDPFNNALHTASDPDQLQTPARVVVFISNLIQAAHIANGEVAQGALAKSRCLKVNDTTARCTSIATINNNNFSDMILEVTRAGTGFTWQSQLRKTSCTTSTPRTCTTPDQVSALSGTVAAVVSNKKLAALTAKGTLPGLGNSQPWLGDIALQIDLAKGYDSKGNLTGPIPVTGSIAVLDNKWSLAPDPKAPQLFQLNLGQGSTITLTAGAAPKAASLNLATTTPTRQYSLTGKLTLSNFVARPRNGKDDRIPATLAFQGNVTHTSAPGTRFDGLVSLDLPTLVSFDPTKPESTANYMREIRKASGTAELGNGNKLQLSTLANNSRPDLLSVRQDYLLTTPNWKKLLVTELTANPLKGDTTMAFRSDSAVKIVLREKNDKENGGTVYNGATVIGNIESNGDSGKVSFVDGSTMALGAGSNP